MHPHPYLQRDVHVLGGRRGKLEEESFVPRAATHHSYDIAKLSHFLRTCAAVALSQSLIGSRVFTEYKAPRITGESIGNEGGSNSGFVEDEACGFHNPPAWSTDSILDLL